MAQIDGTENGIQGGSLNSGTNMGNIGGNLNIPDLTPIGNISVNLQFGDITIDETPTDTGETTVIEETITYVIDMLKYFSMVSIMNHKINDQIATISQIGVYLSSFVYYMINIGLVFVTEKTPDFIRIISKTSYRLINICIFTFVIYQLFAEEELKLAQVAEEKPKEAPNPQAFQTNGPRFRNPALEAQQARLAQQQNQQQPMNNQMGQNQFQQPPINQPTMTGQPMMSEQMLNQPPIVNQQQPMNNQMNNNNSINNL